KRARPARTYTADDAPPDRTDLASVGGPADRAAAGGPRLPVHGRPGRTGGPVVVRADRPRLRGPGGAGDSGAHRGLTDPRPADPRPDPPRGLPGAAAAAVAA